MTARTSTRAIVALIALPLGLLTVTIVGVVVAISGAGLGCHAGSPPSRTGAASEIPAARLRIYRAAAQRFDIDWAFLASIGAQECHHGSCAGDNGSGCAGPMQIAVRRGSPCSPGDGPTLWERFGVDADHDGRTDPDDPADAVFTAARILRDVEHAPPTGGSYDQYHRAACGYYGACGDATADYADQVMARAVAYGFGRGARLGTGGCGGGAGTGLPDSGDVPAEVERDRSPGGLVSLPRAVTGGVPIRCDRRIVSDVVWIARRFHVRVTACFAIHATGGEHPLGAAVDLVPDAGLSWPRTTERLARAMGWKRSCAASGVAPSCARPPLRFIGYDGYPGHGDPAHCRCSGNAHLHLSWLTSASEGQPQHAQRGAYFAPDWIDVFENYNTNNEEQHQ